MLRIKRFPQQFYFALEDDYPQAETCLKLDGDFPPYKHWAEKINFVPDSWSKQLFYNQLGSDIRVVGRCEATSPPISHFNAPPTKPRTICRWKHKYSTSTGIIDSTIPAAIAPKSEYSRPTKENNPAGIVFSSLS